MTDESSCSQETQAHADQREPIDRLWKTLKRGLQDGAEIAINKAEALTKIGRARLDVAAGKTRLGRLQSELGELVFNRFESGETNLVAQDEQIDDLRSQIRQARVELADAEAAFAQVKSGGDL